MSWPRREAVVSPRPSANWIALATAAAASVTIFILAGGVRPGGRPVALVVASAMQALAVAAACCAFAVGRGGAPRSRRALVAVIVLAPIVLLAGKLLLGAAWAGAGPTSYPVPIGFRCLALSIAVGAAPLAALLRMWPGRSTLHGAALGVAAGAAAWSFADAWCPVAEPQHLAIGHLLPVALLVFAGAVSLRRRPGSADPPARRSPPEAPPPAAPNPPR